DMNLDSISKMILGDVEKVRKEHTNDLDKLMNFVGSLPRWFLEIFFWILRKLEYHGAMPKDLTAGDPNYSTALLSNLGSIKAGAPYHHLSEYGTCSIMITIGTIHKENYIKDDGSVGQKDLVEATFTIDERLADGFYYAKSLRITKYLLEHPECLTETVETPVPVEL
ncbi:MAG: 2-oxo acid dehydrogenase subunit E2, partial [Firmicutes bacterium]|nr:2-oxo acid dehydrogenase subunit E2 [Bacillota bacterium]